MNKDTMIEVVKQSGHESCEAMNASMEKLSEAVVDAAVLCASAIKSGGKILICGNGGSAADSQHMAAELVGRFLKERAPYAAIALTTDTSISTAISNDYGFETLFERQVLALGREGDVLIGISTSGNSQNVLLALDAAAGLGMKSIGLTGMGGGKMAEKLNILLDAQTTATPRVQEVHGALVHILCDLIETTLCE